jgi:hypothetical protein
VNDQQHASPAGGILRGELAGHLGIRISKEGIVGIEHFEAVFRFIDQRILAVRNDHRVFNAIPVKVGSADDIRGALDPAGRTELLLHEIVIHLGRLRQAKYRQENQCRKAIAKLHKNIVAPNFGAR